MNRGKAVTGKNCACNACTIILCLRTEVLEREAESSVLFQTIPLDSAVMTVFAFGREIIITHD